MAQFTNTNLLLQAFIFIFLASLPGRTTFLMIIMAARAEATRVFTGASLAFAAQCAISVAIGNVLAFVPKDLLHVLVGLLFLYFGYHFWKSSRHPEKADPKNPEVTIRNVFSVVFAGEWGDVSQIAIASYSAEHSEKAAVFVSALAALLVTTLIAVGLGKVLGRSLRPQYIQMIAAIGFVGVGLYMIAKPVVELLAK